MWNCLSGMSVIIPSLFSVAFLTLFESHSMGTMQSSLGPNLVWIYGGGQALADALKLLVKEFILPSIANKHLFVMAPVWTLLWAILIWMVLPFGEHQLLLDLDFSLIFIYAVASLGSYGILLSGWASNAKYSFFGAVRSVSQMISYEVSMGILWLNILMLTNSSSLVIIVLSQESIPNLMVLPMLFILFFMSCLAETSRAPFDLSEAETELMAGFHLELSAADLFLIIIWWSLIGMMANLIEWTMNIGLISGITFGCLYMVYFCEVPVFSSLTWSEVK